MQFRMLGNTGLRVSQLGFGAMRLPMIGEGAAARVNRELAVPMIRRAFESGVNYIDTAIGYCNQDSQRAVGEALKGWRERVILSTKNHYYGTEERVWWKHLEDSLERLQVSCIDVYNHHGVNAKSYAEFIAPHMATWMRKAQAQGLIRHIACSFHDNNAALEALVDTGYPEIITLQYNLLDRQLEAGMARAHQRGIGIVAMGPVAGGRLGLESEVLQALVPGVSRVPDLALRFVLSNPHASIALSGMSTLAQVEENLATCHDAVVLSVADRERLDEHLARLKTMADLYCSGCDYCLPCPKDVRISQIFRLYNQARVYGLWPVSREAYAQIGANQWNKGAKADACAGCGVCEGKCPQKLPIRLQLQEAHAALNRK